MTSQEKKNDRWGMGISLGIHAALLLLFLNVVGLLVLVALADTGMHIRKRFVVRSS